MIYTPEPYQVRGTQWILDHPRAALFAEMGLGKTAMTLDAIDTLFTDCMIKGVLIVAPVRVASLQWPNEIRQWDKFRWLRHADLRTKRGWDVLRRKGALVYTISYEMLPKLAKEYLFGNHDVAFDCVVFDELSKAKNHESRRIKALKPYLPKFRRRIGLTGTPVPNSYLDLWAQISLLDDGAALGTSFYAYRSRFFSSDYMGYSWTLNKGCKELIDERVARVALTLRASDYLDIPDTRTEDIEVVMPSEAMHAYKELEKELLVRLKSGEVEALSAAALVNKLLQIASGVVYDAERNVHHVHDAKLKALGTLLKEVKEPVLVATNFIHERDAVLRAFPQAKAWSDELLALWNRGEVPMLVSHPASIGHGLNLQHGGRTVVWFSPTWSRELYDQFNARVARKGQAKTPQVFRLVASGTADEAVLEALRQKHDTQSGLLASLAALQTLRT
jgi:SNF2 family DNA or RNA helicase